MKKNAVIILTPGFPASEHDTACLPQIQQFCLLAKEEFPAIEFKIIALQYPFRRAQYAWRGITVYAAGGNNRGSIQRLFTWMRAWRQLRIIAKNHELKGVLSLWLTETAFLGKWFARSQRVKHYTWLQGQDAKKQNRYVRISGLRGDRLIAISGFNKSELQANHGIKAFLTAHNGVNEKIFPQLNTGVRDIDVLGAGSLIPLKKYDVFVRVIHELRRQMPEIRTVIAGAGPEERRLQELVFSLGLQHNLKFAGELPHSAVLAMMNRSKVFLHPSSYEGLSTVMLEALYSGCDVVGRLPVSEQATEHFTRCENENEMKDAVTACLAGNRKRGRVLLYNMRDTARKIIGLFVDPA